MAKRRAPHNPTSRVHKVVIDGTEFDVEFNFRAYAAMHELTGISLIKGWDPTAIDAKEIACLLYSGLLTHHRDIDLEWCFNSLRADNFGDVYSVVLEAYKASLPQPKGDANPPKPVGESN